jgi:hypothetical protein
MGGKSWDSDLLLVLILISLEPGGAIVVSQFAGLMGGIFVMGILTAIVWIFGAIIWRGLREIGRLIGLAFFEVVPESAARTWILGIPVRRRN